MCDNKAKIISDLPEPNFIAKKSDFSFNKILFITFIKHYSFQVF